MNTNGYIMTSAGGYSGAVTTSGYFQPYPTLYTCPKCGGYRCDGYYVGDVVGRWCNCPNDVHTRYGCYQSPRAWECPRCHKIKAPHVDECDCAT